MDQNGNVVELSARVRLVRERDGLALDNERIRNLAYQATMLPTTLSRREIEELGLAVLTHMRHTRRIV